MTRLEQARQRRVRRSREEPAVAEELLRLVERLERTVGRQAALVRPALLELGELALSSHLEARNSATV
jgi:hypothetical protein